MRILVLEFDKQWSNLDKKQWFEHAFLAEWAFNFIFSACKHILIYNLFSNSLINKKDIG